MAKQSVSLVDGKTSGPGAETRATSFSAFANGLGVVPRRGFDVGTLAFLKQAELNPALALLSWSQTAPSRLLSVLCDVHPMFGMARENDLSLAFSPDDTHIVAVSVQKGKDASGAETSSEVIDADGTAALDALWELLPPEAGGLAGLQETLYDQAMTAGMACAEAVPGPRGSGLSDIATFDPNTTRFVDTPAGRLLQQNQGGNWATLDRNFCLAVPKSGTRDNPYGRPGRAQALSEGLRDLRDHGQMDDILEQVAWPRLSVGFPFEQAVQFAKDNEDLLIGQGDGGSDLTPVEWVMAQFDGLVEKVAGQSHKGVFVRLKGAEATILSGAESLADLDKPLSMRRLRLIQGLDQLPTLMGVDMGGTLAFSSTQWRVQAKKLERLRAFVNGILVRLATLHLRLLGLNLTARADVEPIQTSDKLADEQARSFQISNEYRLVDEGAQTENEAAVNLTGSGPVGPRKTQDVAPPGEPSPEPAPSDDGTPAAPPKEPNA